MRNKHHHTKHCQCIDQPGISDSERDHYSKVYGVNRTSILCELPNFDVTEQLPQDLMHVLLEGVFPIHVNQLLKYLVDAISFVTLDKINCRIMSHPYAYFEEKPAHLRSLDPHGNQSGIAKLIIRRSIIISYNYLLSCCSAAQMWELFNILPFLVGKQFPPCNPHYDCFMLLNDISTILFSPVIAHDQIPFLRVQIQQYLQQFTSLYPHRPLTPKFHFLVHLPNLINRYIHSWYIS